MNHDLIDVLLEDHWYLERLLDRLERDDDPEHLQRLVADLADAVGRHEATEVELVAPVLGVQHEDGSELQLLLDALQHLRPASHGFRKRAASLVLALQAHLRTEEELVLPLLRERLSAKELARLGDLAADRRHRADVAV